MALEYPLVVTLEPVSRHRLRAVLSIRGEVIDIHDVNLEAGTPGALGGDLCALVEAANLQGRVVEIAAAWPVPMIGALTLRQKLRRYLAEYRGPNLGRAA